MVDAVWHAGIHVGLRAQDEIVGVEAVGPLAFDPLDFGPTQARLDRADDRQRDLVLQREDVVELAVVALGPDVGAGRRIDELAGDAHAIRRLAHAAFEHVAHAEFAADLLHVDRRPL